MITVKSKEAKYQVEVANGQTTIVGDIPEDRGGSGKYFTPTEILASSLGMCLNITARFILEKRNIAYRDITTKVELEDVAGEKTMFKYAIIIDADISDADKDKYAKMALAGCHVHKMLEQKLEFVPIK